mgnify:CR=1 FL=1
MAKEYFPFTGKIPFEGKDSKKVEEPKTSGKKEKYETIVALYAE